MSAAGARVLGDPRPVPPMAAPQPIRPLQTAAITGPNGLHVRCARRSGVPLIELRLWVPVGTDQAATAELLAAALPGASAQRDRAGFDAALAAGGGSVRITVDPQRLLLSATAPAASLTTLLTLLGDCLTGAHYRPTDLDEARQQLIQRIAVAQRQPALLVRAALRRRCFGDHPLAGDMPTAAAVAAVSADQLRDLHRSVLVPAGARLVLVADLAPADAATLAGDLLGGWRGGPAVPMAPPPSPPGDGLVHPVDSPGARSAQVRLAARSVPRTDHRFAAVHLAELVLGGYFSSRLFERIREAHGYTYDLRLTREEYGDRAVVVLGFDTAVGTAAPAIRETRRTIDELASTAPPSSAEITAARQYATGMLRLATASQSGLANTLIELASAGLAPEWLATHRQRLAEVPDADVRAAAAEFLAADRFTGVVLGPADALDDL